MTDPERISRRPTGLSGVLLRAGLEEQPSPASVERALVALGVSGALVTSGVAAQAAAGGAKLGGAVTGGGAVAVKATSAALLVKWIGVGVVSGVGLAGVASLASGPAAPEPSSAATPRRPVPERAPLAPHVAVAAPPAAPVVPSRASRPSARAESPPLALPSRDDGAPLAAEVALIDEARDALAAGQSERALALLTRYEREFPGARLWPEALFLTLEASERLGRRGEARRAAEQLLRGFPRSPHAARARRALER